MDRQANTAKGLSSLLYGRELTERQMSSRKGMYLEALIGFTEIFAETEIGDAEVDIEKASLYVNSPLFENTSAYGMHTLADAYRQIESDVLHGLPIWNFLKLTPYQSEMMERTFVRNAREELREIEAKSPCFTCVFYRCEGTQLGSYEYCTGRRLLTWRIDRGVGFAPTRVRNCPIRVGMEDTEEFISCMEKKDGCGAFPKIPEYRRRDAAEEAGRGYAFLKSRKTSVPMYHVPRTLDEHIDLSKTPDALEELGYAFSGKRTLSELQSGLRVAMYESAMIRFFGIYARDEIGCGFTADVRNIAVWVSHMEKERKLHAMSEEEVYPEIEGMLTDGGTDIRRFVKRKQL